LAALPHNPRLLLSNAGDQCGVRGAFALLYGKVCERLSPSCDAFAAEAQAVIRTAAGLRGSRSISTLFCT